MAAVEGKVALITGAAQGIGRAIAEEFLRNRMKVAIADINESGVTEAVTEWKSKFGKNEIIGFTLDVRNETQFEDTIKQTKSHFKSLDVLVNNAGILNEAKVKETVEINFMGMLMGTNLALRHLVNSKGERDGMVINTASVAGFVLASITPTYTATKHGVLAYSRCMGNKNTVKKTGIKVNAVCPDVTKTELIDNFYEVNEKYREIQSKIYNNKHLSPAEVAKGFLKVLQDDVTGEALVVSVRKGVYYLPDEKKDVF